MHSKKISTTILILAIMTIASIQIINYNAVDAVISPELPGSNISIDDEASEVIITKTIITRKSDPVEFYKSYINETFTVIIEIQNTAVNPIYNVSMICPEIDVEVMNDSYKEEWFTFQGDLQKNFTQINSGQTVSASYTVTSHKEYNFFSFNPTNATYAWNETNSDVSYSNKVGFIVYEEPPSVRIEKFLVINGVDKEEGRISVEDDFAIKVVVTNFEYVSVNLSIIDEAPGDDFDYNESELKSTKNILATNKTYSYSYNVLPTANDTFVFGHTQVNVTYTNDSRTLTYLSKNTLTLTVYRPDYNGSDWAKIVPMISVKKYFAIWDEEAESYNYFSEYSVYNHTNERVMVLINITNIGEITAYNLTIEEEEYRDWVFETDNLEVWEIDELRQGENRTFIYYITARIVGDFKIEPTKVTYVYKNPKTMLYEYDQIIYSNVLELNVKHLVPEPDLTKQKWAAFGLSMGIIAIAVIPTIIAFVSFRNRRKTQKGI